MILPLFFAVLSASPGTPPLVDIFLIILGIVGAILELRKIAKDGDLTVRVALVEREQAYLLKCVDRLEAIVFAPEPPEEMHHANTQKNDKRPGPFDPASGGD